MATMIESAEAARRLGVKPATLYAYVSRGLLTSYPSDDPRRRNFDLTEVEKLARRSRGAVRGSQQLATITTSITQLSDEGHRYRGQSALDLALDRSFETVAELLWHPFGADASWQPLDVGPCPLPARLDRLRWVAVMAGAADPWRSDLRAEAVVDKASRLIATMAQVLSDSPSQGASVA